MSLRRSVRRFFPALLVALLAAPLGAQQPPSRLAVVLHQLDEASERFKSAEADLQRDVYEQVVRDTTTDCGSIYYIKTGGAIQMGARTVTSASNSCGPVSGGYSRVVEYKGGTLAMYEPKANKLDVFRAGPNQAQYESFLTLGFGARGSELQKVWKITDEGTEVLKDGGESVTTEKLDLVGRDPAIVKNFTHITIWIDPVRDISLKQQFFAAGGNYSTNIFSHIRYNQAIGKSDLAGFAIKTDKQTVVTTH